MLSFCTAKLVKFNITRMRSNTLSSLFHGNNGVSCTNQICLRKYEVPSTSLCLWSSSSAGLLRDVQLQLHPKSELTAHLLAVNKNTIGFLPFRGKKTKRKDSRLRNKADAEEVSDDDESDDEDWEEDTGLDYQDFRARIPSLRLDSILKSGLKMSRSKVEHAFYSSRIRVNEQKILKKSKQLSVGDEVDVIKESLDDNPDLVYVARVVILKVGSYDSDSDKVTVMLRRYKNLLIRKNENERDTE